jgi:hypothetical protein
MPGARDLEEAWLRARAGEGGYLTGKDAEAAACDAQSVPVVTGTMDDTVIDQMINLARTAAEAGAPDDATDSSGTSWAPDGPDAPRAPDGPGASRPPGGSGASGPPPAGPHPGGPGTGERLAHAPPGPAGLSPGAWRALRYAMARLAVDLVSGPSGVAAILRTGLLDKPYNTPSLPLDIGYSDTIPWQIRRAVLLRDRKCAWPRCGRPAVHCDVHHLRHKQDGGATALENLTLLCQFHHDVCIHRKGWQLILHPDGTTEARSPDGKQILHSHAPPAEQAA